MPWKRRSVSSSLSSLPSGQNAGKCWTQRWKPYVRKAGVMTEGTWVPNEHRAPASHPDFCLERNIHLSGLSSCHFMLRCHTGPPCGIPTHTAILDSPLCHPLIHPFIQSDWFYSQIIWPSTTWPFLTSPALTLGSCDSYFNGLLTLLSPHYQFSLHVAAEVIYFSASKVCPTSAQMFVVGFPLGIKYQNP